MSQIVIMTLRGSVELKEMLITLSKIRHEPMNIVVQDLIRKEYEDDTLNVREHCEQGGLASPVVEIGESIERKPRPPGTTVSAF